MSTHRHKDVRTFVQFTHKLRKWPPRQCHSRQDSGGRQAANLNFCGQPDAPADRNTYIYILLRRLIYIYICGYFYMYIKAPTATTFLATARIPRTLITCWTGDQDRERRELEPGKLRKTQTENSAWACVVVFHLHSLGRTSLRSFKWMKFLGQATSFGWRG